MRACDNPECIFNEFFIFHDEPQFQAFDQTTGKRPMVKRHRMADGRTLCDECCANYLMRPDTRLASIEIRSAPGGPELRLHWSNDFHQAVKLGGMSSQDVELALLEAYRLVNANRHAGKI